MHLFKVWIISGWVHMAVGAILMFIVLKRPQMLKDAEARVWAWIKKRLGMS